ncbi:MAG: ATP-binding cassette domain-containing protein [Deltaproteobacteria bacterium]|nr:ATP-binding cassette domain-containing protein [Deltaproteobacteria bacterium]
MTVNQPLLRVEGLTKHFPVQKGLLDRISFQGGRLALRSQVVHAVNGVNLVLARGETLALVGESGCGKSTLAKTIIGLHTPTAGQVYFEGQEISRLQGRARKPFRKKIQMIFQDPFSSLNPRKKVMDIIAAPMKVHGLVGKTDRQTKVYELMEKVGLHPAYANRYPHQFSGGQRQRIGIARSLASLPELIIADEPISALDVSIQAQVLNLLMAMQEEFHLTYLFVSHDLSVVKHLSNRVAVMYLGFLVEVAETEAIFLKPAHPYTRLLFAAIPTLDVLEFREGDQQEGEVPTPIDLTRGCPFHPRCGRTQALCREMRPELTSLASVSGGEHLLACHYPVRD